MLMMKKRIEMTMVKCDDTKTMMIMVVMATVDVDRVEKWWQRE